MSDFEITRRTQIGAAPEQVRALIDDLKVWESWSPWEDLDPNMTHTYTGPERGDGAKHVWNGNRNAGEGSMQITASTPQQVDLTLAFIKPFKATNQVRFDIAPADDGTAVVWTMTGHRGLMGRAFAKVFKMDDKLGADFDKGLSRLKGLAEGG